jgi:hypothetical protein
VVPKPHRGPQRSAQNEDDRRFRPQAAHRAHRPLDQRARPQRWHAAVAELLALRAESAAWYDALPDSLRGSATAEALEAIAGLDLKPLAEIIPPRGCGHD